MQKKKTAKKYEAKGGSTDSYLCKECGHNPTHSTVNCYILKNRAKQEQGANGEGKAQAKPYSKRTFCKEVNTMARKAAKNGSLEMYATALKREQAKLDRKVKKTKKRLLLTNQRNRMSLALTSP